MKTRTTIYRYLQAVGLVGALASVAQADTTIIDGFGTPYLFASGDALNYGMAYADGAGPGGSRAIVITTDFAGRGWGQIDYSDRYEGVSGNTSANLSDYALSFDAAAKAKAAHPGFWLVVSGVRNGTQSQGAAFLTISDPSSYQHFSLNLGSNLNGVDPLSSWWQLDFNMESPDFGDPSAGDQLCLSNIRLTMVPEPSSLVLTLLPLAGLVGMGFYGRQPVHMRTSKVHMLNGKARFAAGNAVKPEQADSQR